jgi:hypothetical protein
MATQQMEFNDQVAAYKQMAESQLVYEQLKVHLELAKPYFAMSNWLLVIDAGALTSAIAKISELKELLEKGPLVVVLTLLALSALCGLFAKQSEVKAVGIIAITTAMFESLERFNSRHNTKLGELEQHAQRTGVTFNRDRANPDPNVISKPMTYPSTWWSRWTYGTVSGDSYSDCPVVLRAFSVQAFSAQLQLLLLVLAIGFAAIFSVANV